MARRRRGRRRLALLAVLIVCLGVRDSFGPAPVRGSVEPVATEPASVGAGSPAPESVPDASVEPARDVSRAALLDRFGGFLRAMASDDFAAALRAADAAAQLDLRDEERAELERARGVLDIRFDGEIAACAALATSGYLLDATTRLRGVFELAGERVLAALSGGVPPGGISPGGDPAGLGRGTRARFRDESGLLREAEIAQVTGDQITLRVREPSGYRFPTVDALLVEPVDGDLSFARAQVERASARRDALSAAMWRLRASSLAR